MDSGKKDTLNKLSGKVKNQANQTTGAKSEANLAVSNSVKPPTGAAVPSGARNPGAGKERMSGKK